MNYSSRITSFAARLAADSAAAETLSANIGIDTYYVQNAEPLTQEAFVAKLMEDTQISEEEVHEFYYLQGHLPTSFSDELGPDATTHHNSSYTAILNTESLAIQKTWTVDRKEPVMEMKTVKTPAGLSFQREVPVRDETGKIRMQDVQRPRTIFWDEVEGIVGGLGDNEVIVQIDGDMIFFPVPSSQTGGKRRRNTRRRRSHRNRTHRKH